jgi:hypothetical protein
MTIVDHHVASESDRGIVVYTAGSVCDVSHDYGQGGGETAGGFKERPLLSKLVRTAR